jgi:hypothetical protein
MGYLSNYYWYENLGIPSDYVSQPLQQYMLLGWLLALAWIAITAFFLLPLGLIAIPIVGIVQDIGRSRFFNTLKRVTADAFSIPQTDLSRIRSYFFTTPLLAMLGATFLLLSSSFAFDIARGVFGNPSPITDVESLKSIEIMSSHILFPHDAIQPPPLIAAGEQPVYQYQGFHLIVHANGRYILFRNLDPGTCRPTDVFIIHDDQIISVILRPLDPTVLPPTCRGSTLPSTGPTSIREPVATTTPQSE